MSNWKMVCTKFYLCNISILFVPYRFNKTHVLVHMSVIVSCDVGTKNLALCIIDVSPKFDTTHILSLELLQITKSKSFNTILISDTLNSLDSWFKKNTQAFINKKIHFVIERQPNKSYLMSMVMASVLSWAQCKLNNVISIQIANPKHKFGFDNKTKLSYQNRKKKAIEITLKITKDSPWHTFILSHTKKDDLCDCLLQGLHFLNTTFTCRIDFACNISDNFTKKIFKE